MVGYHHNDHLGKDRPLAPSQFEPPRTTVFFRIGA